MKMEMEYNTGQPKLVIPEYGRNIQKMINFAIKVKDREERNTVAKAIIMVMGQLNPHLRDVTDFKHKLWDHLFIISNFKLDVDSPYPKPTAETFQTKPDLLKYPSKAIKYKRYGKTIERIIEKAIAYKEGDEKNALIASIANLMKRSYLSWNTDSVNDEVIMQHLKELSKGKLKPAESFRLSATNEILAKTGIRKPSPGHREGGHRNDGHRRDNRRSGGGGGRHGDNRRGGYRNNG